MELKSLKDSQMHMLAFSHKQPIDRDERKLAGQKAQVAYPKGYKPVREHPCLFCQAGDRDALRARLTRQPWKEWYYSLLRPLAEVALASRDLAELRSPLFAMRVFPVKGSCITPVQAMGGQWKASVCNCAFVGFLEENERFVAKARQLLLEATEPDVCWSDGGWGGEDYDLDSGWSFAWIWSAGLAIGYDLIATSFSAAERRRFEARLARDLEFCQTDPISPRYNPSWVGATFMGLAALLLGRDDAVRKTEALLDQYVEQTLYGEGEYWEGAGYQTCMEPQNIMLLTAIHNVTGRDPAANERWAERAEHWIRRAGPLGTDVTHSDCQLVGTTAHLLLASLPLLPPDVAGWAMWMGERIGDPGWLPLRGSDDERRRGVDRPATIGDAAVPERKRRYPYGIWADPSFWLMVPDPLPAPVEPPPGSYVARNAGLACLRANWSMEAMHTSFFAPRFYGSPHSHWDSLTFDFWAHGAYLVKNAGYHELDSPTPRVPEHLRAALGVEPKPTPITPPLPWDTWQGWDNLRCFRMAPDMHNIPTVERGGGNHWTSRADPLHYLVNTGPVQAVRAAGGIAGSYARIGKLGADGTVVRTLAQIEPASEQPGYLLVVDDITPTELPNARCDWFLHPRGKHAGAGSRQSWTTCDFLNFPPKDVRLEVCLPPEGLEYELKPDGHHLTGGSFQPGEYLDVFWNGRRRFWAALRPAREGEYLPPAEDLPDNLGLRIGNRDRILIRPIGEEALSFDGLTSDATLLVVRDGADGFYLAVAARRANVCGGTGFEASAEIMLAAHGLTGSVFCDRPHKQPHPMTPVRLTVRDQRFCAGALVTLNGRQVASCSAGSFEVVLAQPGQHSWSVSGPR